MTQQQPQKFTSNLVNSSHGDGMVTSLSWTRSGNYLLSASEDDKCRIYSPRRRDPVDVVELKHCGCSLVAATHQETVAIVAPRSIVDDQLFLIDLHRAEVLGAYRFPGLIEKAGSLKSDASEFATDLTRFSGMSLNPASDVFAVGARDIGVALFSSKVSSAVMTVSPRQLERPLVGRTSVSFSPTGTALAMSDDDTIAIFDWRVMGHGPFSTLRASSVMGKGQDAASGTITSLEFHPESDADLLVSTSDCRASLLNIVKGQSRFSYCDSEEVQGYLLPRQDSHARDFAPQATFSPDGVMVAMGAPSGLTLLFDAWQRPIVTDSVLWSTHTTHVYCARFHPFSTLLATAGKSVHFWEVSSPLAVDDKP